MSTPPPTTTTVTAFADEWLPELTHPLANWPGHWFETADNPLAETILSTDHVYMKQLLDVLHLFDDDAARQNISPTDFHNREHIRFDSELQKPWSSKYINLFATAMFLRELVITSVWWSHLWRVREVTYTKRATNWSTDA
ncbi:hypothetical protein DOTSEDRAFT_75466 [Dothistroma septosporum NZE10]|uniref:Uncharacterized protein n=1 Tax=Dothistroma septosporum (strain NZE10 / CBS 128990) TaxID=675120 RepID=M2YIF4_DOTSN|nr:hypothetical protein DOTSEDRAFT_75466 [Dothistroma septosporum NZE10]